MAWTPGPIPAHDQTCRACGWVWRDTWGATLCAICWAQAGFPDLDNEDVEDEWTTR